MIISIAPKQSSSKLKYVVKLAPMSGGLVDLSLRPKSVFLDSKIVLSGTDKENITMIF